MVSHKYSYDNFFEAYTRFKTYVLADLEKLEIIAEEVAKEEYFQYLSGTTTLETSSKDGNAIPIQDLFIESRCTIPISMICFSVLDFIGQMSIPIHDDSQEIKDLADGFAKHAQIFFYYLAKKDDLKRKEKAESFQNKYRHSIMHTFLPSAKDYKSGYSVAYRDKEITAHALISSEHCNTKEEVLNVRYMLDCIKCGLTNFDQILQSGKYNNEITRQYNKCIDKENY